MKPTNTVNERIKKLAAEKAYLQLVIELMNQLSKTPGLENTVANMLACVSENIGGTDSIIYYRFDDSLYRASILSPLEKIERISDPLVLQVYEQRNFIEFEHDFRDTQMTTPAFSKAWTWGFPLLVGDDLIGVFKVENLHISVQEMRTVLPTFFRFAALILKNEILGHTRLQAAYEELSAVNRELIRARDELERRVLERTEELRELNQGLEARVAAEVAKNREMDHILIQQSRLAAMGEMVHNIAHQWRQPLNALGLVVGNVHADFCDGVITRETLEQDVATARRLIKGMTTTIDEFRDFFRPDRETIDFDVAESVREAIAIVNASMKNNHVDLEYELEDGLLAMGHPNQYAQAVLNVVVNAKDVMVAKKIKDGRIRLKLMRVGNNAELTIEDDGGGIPEDILPKIFDPYFTTKDQGSGIGLYMAKMIIEKTMGGQVEAANMANGARFIFRLPLLLRQIRGPLREPAPATGLHPAEDMQMKG